MGSPELSNVTPIESHAAKRAEAAGGGGGGGVDVRIATLEANVGHISREMSDVRLDIRQIRDHMAKLANEIRRLTYAGIGAAVFLLCAGAASYVKLADRIDGLSVRMDAGNTRLSDRMDRLVAQLNTAAARLDGRIDGVNGRIDGLNGRIDVLAHEVAQNQLALQRIADAKGIALPARVPDPARQAEPQR